MTPIEQLASMQSALTQLRAGTATIAGFALLAQQQAALMGALPSRYADVLEQLLNRLESGALFTEGSCSFSQTDLLDNVQLWIDKAGPQLQKT